MTVFKVKDIKPTDLDGISEENIDQHFDLYEKYVSQCNKLLTIEKALQSQDTFAAKTLRVDLLRQLAFERNGVILHELFFEELKGKSAPKKNGNFVKLAKKSFGSLDNWMDDIRALNALRGNGWAIAGYDFNMKALRNTVIDDHSLNVQLDIIPLCVIDLWEHSFVLDFSTTGRDKYLEAVFKNIDWAEIDTRARVCV